MGQPISYKKAVASLSLGIISIVCTLGFFYTSFFGVIFGILAIIFGQKARKEAKTPLATAGLVCGIIGTSLCGLLFVGCSGYAIYFNNTYSSYYWWS